MGKMDWRNATETAFNYYFNAIRKGNSHDDAATWFLEEITEQVAAAGLVFADDWELEISPQSLQLMIDTLANRLKGLNDEQGYAVSADFYGAFHSFFSNIIYYRSEEDPTNFGSLLSYWNDKLWSDLPVK